MKQLLRRLIGEKNLGRLDYYLKPELRESWGGALNGQLFRRQIYTEIIQTIAFDGIVETGTYHGTTTAMFSESGLPVYSVETNPRFYAYATRRFRGQRQQIHLFEGDTRDFLKQLARDPQLAKSRLFFYLDAHSHCHHLPLLEELKIIFERWPEPVIMIDDFCVPGTNYGYDDFGAGNALTLDYLSPLSEIDIKTFFPAVGPEEETGRKRGCVVLCRGEKTTLDLTGLHTLKRGVS